VGAARPCHHGPVDCHRPADAVDHLRQLEQWWSGTAGTTVPAVIAGRNLAGATSVAFSGAGVTAAIGGGGTGSSLPVTITIVPGAAAGQRTVTVTNAFGVSAPFAGFTVTAVPVMTLSQTSLRFGAVTDGVAFQMETEIFEAAGHEREPASLASDPIVRSIRSSGARSRGGSRWPESTDEVHAPARRKPTSSATRLAIAKNCPTQNRNAHLRSSTR
jgi:hypothetical protein